MGVKEQLWESIPEGHRLKESLGSDLGIGEPDPTKWLGPMHREALKEGGKGLLYGLASIAEPILPEETRQQIERYREEQPFTTGLGEFATYAPVLGGATTAVRAGLAKALPRLSPRLLNVVSPALAAGGIEAARTGAEAAMGRLPVPAVHRTQPLEEPYESHFQAWYERAKERFGLPDDPDAGDYDYRALWRDHFVQGVDLPEQAGQEWPRGYELPGHPDFQAYRPAESLGEALGPMAESGLRGAIGMGLFGAAHGALRGLGRPIGRALPNFLKEGVPGRVGRRLAESTQMAGAFPVSQALQGETDLSRLGEEAAIGGLGSLLLPRRLATPFGRAPTRKEALERASLEAVAEGKNPYTEAKSFVQGVKGRIRVGSTRLTPAEMKGVLRSGKEMYKADLQSEYSVRRQRVEGIQQTLLDQEGAIRRLEAKLGARGKRRLGAKRAEALREELRLTREAQAKSANEYSEAKSAHDKTLQRARNEGVPLSDVVEPPSFLPSPVPGVPKSPIGIYPLGEAVPETLRAPRRLPQPSPPQEAPEPPQPPRTAPVRSWSVLEASREFPSSKAEKGVKRRMSGGKAEWVVRAREKGGEWYDVVRFDERQPAEALARSETGKFHQFMQRVVAGKRELGFLTGERDPEPGVRYAYAGLPDAKSIKKWVKETFERRPLEARVNRGEISKDRLAEIKAGHATADTILTRKPDKDYLKALEEASVPKRPFNWPRRLLDSPKNLAEQMDGLPGVTEGRPIRTFERIYRPTSAQYDAMQAEMLRLISAPGTGLRPRLIKAGVDTLSLAERRILADYMENPTIEIDPAVRRKVEPIAKEMRNIFDELFRYFGVKRYRVNYLSRLLDHTAKIYNELPQGVREVDFYAMKRRADEADLRKVFLRDPVKILDIYVRGGMKYKFLAESVRTARDEIKYLRDSGYDMQASYFENVVNGYLGKPSGMQRAMSSVVQANAKILGEIFPRWEGAQLMAQDPYAGDHLTRSLAGLFYMRFLGFRPAAAARNLTQSALAASELGNTHMIRGLLKLQEKGGFASVLKDLTDKGVIKEYALGLDFDPILTTRGLRQAQDRAMKYGMAMFQLADRFNRVATYQAAESRFETALGKQLEKIQAGDQAALRKFLHGAKLTGRKLSGDLSEGQTAAFRRRIQGLVKEGQIDQARLEYGKYFVEKWQFRYGKGGTPLWMQSAVGKVLGQFSTWGLFYGQAWAKSLSSLGKAGKKTLRGHPLEGLGEIDPRQILHLTQWVAVSNLIAMTGSELLNIDVSSWFSNPGHQTQLKIGDEEYTIGLPTAAVGVSPGPMAGPLTNIIDAALAASSGDEYRQDKALERLKREFSVASIPELAASKTLVEALGILMNTGTAYQIRNEDGELLRTLDFWEKVATVAGFRPGRVSEEERSAREIREEQREKRSDYEDQRRVIQRDLARQPWIMQADLRTIRTFVRSRYPSATTPSGELLWRNTRALDSMLERLTTGRARRTIDDEERSGRRRGTGLRGITGLKGLKGL